ncbi:MAG: hypothetical protein K2Y10_04580 [Burkholderiaceae bacterium]|nr:hypothetical protein [Burkholderiaceae bacterium]
MLVAALAACGGGGEASGVNPNQPAIVTTAGSSVSLAAGSVREFQVSGGKPPYRVSNTNSDVAVGTVNGNVLTIRVVAQNTNQAKSANLSILDYSGDSITIAVNVLPDVTDLKTSAPPVIQVATGATNTYTIFGGSRPYSVVSQNAQIVRASVTDGILSLSGVAFGSTGVIVRDTSGQEVSITVGVGASQGLFSDAPGSITMPNVAGTVRTYTISGGSAPYVARSDNEGVVRVSVSGSGLNVESVASGTATITVTDKDGARFNIFVTVTGPQDFFTTAPALLNLANDGNTSSYIISGGSAPYSAVSSDNGVVAASVSGSNLNLRSVGTGSATVTLRDSNAKLVTINVTVGGSQNLFTTAPNTLNLANDGNTSSYVISGGNAPYTVVSNNTGVVRATVSGANFNLQTVGAGVAVVTVSDKNAKTVTINVTVGGAQSLLTTAPSPLNLANDGDTRVYTISGGSQPYVAHSNNEGVVVASVAGANLSLRSVGAGAATVTINDKDGKTVSINVTVGAAQALFTTAPTPLYIAARASNVYQITGGNQPYTASSTDTSVATASVSGSRLTITAVGNGGTATITISDKNSAKAAPIVVNVGSSTAFFINAPSNVKLALNPSQRYAYQLAGGTMNYTVVSSDASVATGEISGTTTLMVTPLKVGTATLQLKDAAGAAIALTVDVTTDVPATPSAPVIKAPVFQSARLLGTTDSSISATDITKLEVTLASPLGVVIPNQLITVSGDATQISFPSGTSALTNSAGVATIDIKRASLTATGAGSLTVTYDYRAGTLASYYTSSAVQPPTVDTPVRTYVGYKLATADISLDTPVLGVGNAALPAYGTTQVTVQVKLNGQPATTTPVQVNFSATCGQISPATASSDNTGKVVVSYSATDAAGVVPSTQGCSGKTVRIFASTPGAPTAPPVDLTINPTPATNISFVSATPNRIYLTNSGGVTQSLVKFKLVNAQGEPIVGRDVKLELKTVAGGNIDATKATFGTVGQLIPITTPTDSNGEVSVPVFSGTVPTNVLVNAKLVATPTIQTDSAVLTIASGRPAQARVSLSIEKFSIEGFSVDGDESIVTMSLADRQGNPVPDGTAVNFVTEGGVMIPPVCTTGTNAQGNSQCAVKIRSQNPRPQATSPRIGRVSILAYAAGEEDFVDANFDNVYNAGEAFTDLGTAYRDDNENGSFDTGEFSVPRTGATPSRGDGVWGAADVRQQQIIIFATSGAVICTNITNKPAECSAFFPSTGSNANGGDVSTSSVSFTVADKHGNSMPTGSVITVTAVDNTENQLGCTVAAGATAIIPNTLDPFPWAASLSKCAVGDSVTIEIKTPKTNTVTGLTVPLR